MRKATVILVGQRPQLNEAGQIAKDKKYSPILVEHWPDVEGLMIPVYDINSVENNFESSSPQQRR